MQNPQTSIAWIDDDFSDNNSDRSRLVRDMETRSKGVLKVIALEPNGVEDWLSGVESGTKPVPSLILIDLFLRSSKVGQKRTLLIFDHGTKLVGLLSTNDQLADVPKYLVSRALEETSAGRQTDQFDWVLTHAQLAESGTDLLLRDTSDYRALKDIFSKIDATARHSNSREFDALLEKYVGLLKVPAVCRDSVSDICKKVLSDLVRGRNTDLGRVRLGSDEVYVARGVVLAAARWVRSLLLKRSGPVIADLLAATTLGAKLEPFRIRVAPILEKEKMDALYSGIFSHSKYRRWWKEAIVDWALQKYNKLPISSPGNFAKSVAEKLALQDNEHATCVVCKEKWPETIARDSEDTSEWRQVHWHCSTIVDESNVPVGFDELREFLAR